MSNPNSPFGLRAVRHYMGGVVRMNQYFIDSGAGSIFTGDPVKTDQGNYGKKIVVASASDILVGVFAGCSYIDSSGAQHFEKCWISGTGIQSGSSIVAHVYDDPMTLFEVQSNGDMEASQLGYDFDLASGVGNATTGQSAWVMNQSVSSNSAAKQFKSIDLSGAAGNAYGNYAKVLGLIAKHELRANIVGV